MDDQSSEITRRLEDLEARIAEKKKGLVEHGALGDPLMKEWDTMLASHAEIRRRLQNSGSKRSEAWAMLAEDVDILRRSFFHWAARVDRRFKDD